ncbi:hypothetical protein ACW2Q0_19665 [Nocardia sp. R16R-3T]
MEFPAASGGFLASAATVADPVVASGKLLASSCSTDGSDVAEVADSATWQARTDAAQFLWPVLTQGLRAACPASQGLPIDLLNHLRRAR